MVLWFLELLLKWAVEGIWRAARVSSKNLPALWSSLRALLHFRLGRKIIVPNEFAGKCWSIFGTAVVVWHCSARLIIRGSSLGLFLLQCWTWSSIHFVALFAWSLLR